MSPHAFKGGAKRKRAPVIADALGPRAEAEAINAVRDDWQRLSGQSARLAEAPGQGEIVDGADAKLADELVSLARSKGGKDKVQAKLRVIREQAGYERAAEIDKANTERLVDVQQRVADRIVCGFLAEVDMAQQLYRGLPPSMVWNMSSFTLTKIVDALNAAGYSAGGRLGR